MATIEERAKKVFPSCVVHYPSDDIPYNRMQSDRRLGYVKGATEQKQIDIDKACEALYILQDQLNADLMNIENAKEIIRKAIEE